MQIRDVEMIEMNERNTVRQIARTVRLAGWLLGLMAAILLQSPAQTRPQAQPAAKSPTAQGTTAKKSAGTSTARPAYDRALLRPALLKEKAPDEYKVQFSTTRGDFVVTVTRSWAPLGADRFYNLVKHHFYDNASFFRVLPGFMAQFGISAYPAVNKVWENANIKDDPVTQSNTRGYVTFATGGANTRTTQVFINFGDNKRLDHDGFAPFGLVTDGIKVVDMFYDQYGEGAPSGGGPDQDQIQKQGKPYLDKGWPKLDFIKTTAIISPPAAAATKPAAGTGAKSSAPAAKKPQ
jgi:peptidyl-prolyl cis-trans isomerase A (cyclophilin A)